MSKENQINNSIFMQFLNPSINFTSLKARLRFKELRNKISKNEYQNYFKKYNKISNEMNRQYSLNDLYAQESKISDKISKEMKTIDNELSNYQKKCQYNQNKYKLKFCNNLKTGENINKNREIIESVKSDISKYLNNLHLNRNDNKGKYIFNKLKLNIQPSLRNNLKLKSVAFNNFNSGKILHNISTVKSKNSENINKNRVKKFISIENSENTKIKLSLFSNKDVNSFNKFYKSPLARQNSLCISLAKQEDRINNIFTYKYKINSKESCNKLINLPNIL